MTDTARDMLYRGLDTWMMDGGCLQESLGQDNQVD
jgi:hypothetical protein